MACRNRACALVLCPNNTLCQQLVSVASRLKNPSGQPLLHTHHLNAYSPPPFDLPDVLVCTPGYLANLFSEHGLSYGSLWTEEGLSRVVGHVVVDEADILLSRAYSRAMDRIEQVRPGAPFPCGSALCASAVQQLLKHCVDRRSCSIHTGWHSQMA